MRLRVRGGKPLAGEARVPPDKSILHRALLLGALGRGPGRVSPMGSGADNRSTLGALAALGVPARIEGDVALIEGVGGPSGLRSPEGVVDCGNSGTTMRLLAGVLAAAEGLSVTLDGDASLRRRPMARLRPLEAMGARLRASDPRASPPSEGDGSSSAPGGAPHGASQPVQDPGGLRAPFVVEGAALRGHDHRLEVASAQVKTALILAGLFAQGKTRVSEPRTSRDHTERMLAARGVRLEREVAPDGRHLVVVEPVVEPWSFPEALVPPDFSSATFLLAAAAITRGRVAVRTGVNPTRTGALDALAAMGVVCALRDEAEEGGEPVATVEAEASGKLRAHAIRGEEALRAIDELPVLAGLAAFAEGTTVIADARELRVKESDRIAAVARALSAFGARVEPQADGLIIHGGGSLAPATVDAEGDHRIAMTSVVVALGIPGESTVEGAEVIGVSFPGFEDTLRALGADVRSEP